MKTTVIHHSADHDGLFCREIARKFLPDAELIGWDFGDAPLPMPSEGDVFVLDLPADRPFGFEFYPTPDGTAIKNTKHPGNFCDISRLTWIDHHASSIASHPQDIPGYRIDGVAACRLAWQWFAEGYANRPFETIGGKVIQRFPPKEMFVARAVNEPLAVRLAGEYDVFDKRDAKAGLFQFALRSCEVDYQRLLRDTADSIEYISILGEGGKALQFARDNEYREVITQQGFDLHFEGLTFLACNSHELDIRSQLFEAGIKPHHDALLGFTFHGKGYRVSLYRIPGKDTDILSIAKKYGGGGHAGACGFQSKILQPFDTIQGELSFNP